MCNKAVFRYVCSMVDYYSIQLLEYVQCWILLNVIMEKKIKFKWCMKHIICHWFGITPEGLQNSIADLMRNSKMLYRRNLTDAFSRKTAITQVKICPSHCSVHLKEPLRPGSISFGKRCSRKQSCKNLCEKDPYRTAVTGPDRTEVIISESHPLKW